MMAKPHVVPIAPRTFFVKIGKDGVPARNVDPQTRADWEQGGKFIAPKARRLIPNPRGKSKTLPMKDDPQKGDGVYIWVNQEDDGKGLTAFGTINEISPSDGKIAFVLRDVKLLGPPYLHYEEGSDPRKFARGAWNVTVLDYTEAKLLAYAYAFEQASALRKLPKSTPPLPNEP
jgi:hypothetical protein